MKAPATRPAEKTPLAALETVLPVPVVVEPEPELVELEPELELLPVCFVPLPLLVAVALDLPEPEPEPAPVVQTGASDKYDVNSGQADRALSSSALWLENQSNTVDS